MDDALLKNYIEQAAKNLLLDTNGDSRTIATRHFQQIQTDGQLTPEERQKVYCGMNKIITEHECNLAVKNDAPGTLMRQDNGANMFAAVYLEHYAKDYFDAVTNKGIQAGKLTKPGQGDELVPDEQATSTAILKAYTSELPNLSREASQFLKVGIDTIKEQMPDVSDQATKMVLVNSVVLRGTLGQEITQNLVQASREQNSELVSQYRTALNGYNNVQRFANSVANGKNGEGTELSQNKKAVKEFNETLGNIADGNTPRFKKLKMPNVDSGKVLQEVDAVRPFQARIKELEKQKNDLENRPKVGDKVKAFFNHGRKGLDGEIAKVDKRIAATQVAKDDVAQGISTKERREEIQGMKDDIGKLKKDINKLASNVTANSLEKGTKNPSVSDAQAQKSMDKLKDKVPERKNLKETVKIQEKSLKVREMVELQSQKQAKGNHNTVKL